MKYPKAWDADSNITVSTHYVDGSRQTSITLRVFKPGTPDHERRIISRLNRNEAIKLYQSLESQLRIKTEELE